MKKNTTKLILISYIYIAICMQIGFYIFGKGLGIYTRDNVIASIIGLVIGGVILILSTIYKNKKNKNIPEFDERSMLVLKNTSHFLVHACLMIGSIIIISLYAMGIHTISTISVACYLGIVYMILGIGILIAKNN